MHEWQEVERRANELKLKTGTYIKRISVNGQISHLNLNDIANLSNALRSIGNNINQIARKANEINSIYEVDIDKLRKEYEEICRMLNQFLYTQP